MSFPRYPSYKDSGVEWLGEVPEHWDIKPVKTVCKLFGRIGYRGYTTEDIVNQGEGAITLSPSNMEDGVVSVEKCTYISWKKYSESPEIMVQPDDIVMVKTGSTFGKVAHIVEVKQPTTINPQLVLFKDISCVSRFLFYVLNADHVRARIDVNNTGSSIPTMTQQSIGNFGFGLPTVLEQTQIAAFLDREIAKIDALVAEQRRLMELLKEKRQGVISHAITKGLNPNAPMKPSGIEWLGDVPEHWEIKSMRYILDAIGDVDHFMPESVEKGVPYLMTGDLKEFVSDVSLDECKQVSHNDYLELSKRIKSSKGDVIMARYATIGTSMYVDIDIDFLVSYSCVTLKPNQSKVSGLYLFQYMKSHAFRQGVENQINTNTQGNVGIKDLQNVKIAAAPIDEQTAIAAFLDSETTKFDTLITEAHRAIDLLQERRTALISAAVTGQIDVRHISGKSAA